MDCFEFIKPFKVLDHNISNIFHHNLFHIQNLYNSQDTLIEENLIPQFTQSNSLKASNSLIQFIS